MQHQCAKHLHNITGLLQLFMYWVIHWYNYSERNIIVKDMLFRHLILQYFTTTIWCRVLYARQTDIPYTVMDIWTTTVIPIKTWYLVKLDIEWYTDQVGYVYHVVLYHQPIGVHSSLILIGFRQMHSLSFLVKWNIPHSKQFGKKRHIKTN